MREGLILGLIVWIASLVIVPLVAALLFPADDRKLFGMVWFGASLIFVFLPGFIYGYWKSLRGYWDSTYGRWKSTPQAFGYRPEIDDAERASLAMTGDKAEDIQREDVPPIEVPQIALHEIKRIAPDAISESAATIRAHEQKSTVQIADNRGQR